jgi:uncharacterized protein
MKYIKYRFMIIDFREIELGKTKYYFDVEPESVGLEYPDVAFRHNVQTAVSALAVSDEIIIDGNTGTIATAECHRCLKTVELQINAAIRLIIQRTDNYEEKDTGDENFVTVSKSESQYDLKPYCREVLLMEIPDKVLCKDDCRGLCPVCGADLNVEQCQCRVSGDGGQWDRLKELLEKDNG